MSDSEICRFLVFRHGQTDWNAEGRLQGHLDVALNAVGRREARAIAETLAPFKPTLMLSSDLRRARETAALVVERLGIVLKLERGLREVFLGQAQGQLIHELDAKFGEGSWSRWISSSPEDDDARFPGSENKIEPEERAARALEFWAESTPHATIAACTHGFVLARLLRRFSGKRLTVEEIANGSLYQWEFDRRRRRWFC